MGLFENYGREILDIEKEIERKGVVLGIDWQDTLQVRELARAALHHGKGASEPGQSSPLDRQDNARLELFGLIALMLKTMEQSAVDGMEAHGGPVWKLLGRALWQESEADRHVHYDDLEDGEPVR